MAECYPPPKNRKGLMERRVKVFRNGINQAVRIPRDFELPGTDAVMRKEGKRLVIELAQRTALAELIAAWAEEGDLGDDESFPTIDDPPPEPIVL
jgi:antitoxin VapB